MAGIVDLSPATVADAEELARTMRAADADELRAATGREPLPVMVEGVISATEAWAVRVDGELMCLFGVTERAIQDARIGRQGIGWLLCTDLVERLPVTFWKLCLMIFPGLFSRWEVLANAIDVRHTQALRWARRLGFQLLAPEPFGAAGLPFHLFHFRREDFECARQS